MDLVVTLQTTLIAKRPPNISGICEDPSQICGRINHHISSLVVELSDQRLGKDRGLGIGGLSLGALCFHTRKLSGTKFFI